jgi:hypothetical protein
VITRAFHRGLLLLPCGTSTLRFMPPLMIDEGHVDEAMQLLEAAMMDALGWAASRGGDDAQARAAVARVLACAGALAAGRERVLKQIDLPHNYYFREMYLPQLTSGPQYPVFSPDGSELVYSMAGSLWRQRIGEDEAARSPTAQATTTSRTGRRTASASCSRATTASRRACANSSWRAARVAR